MPLLHPIVCRNIFLLFLGFMMPAMATYAQKDSIKIQTRFLLFEDVFSSKETVLHSRDTNPEAFHYYKRIESSGFLSLHTGNLGVLSQSLEYDPQFHKLYQIGMEAFDPYRFKQDNLKYYDTYTPYFAFSYGQGSMEMQKFSALHTRNINPWWNMSLAYESDVSQGFYRQQENRVKNVAFTSHYSSKNKRYHLYAGALSNRISAQEHGGVSNDSLYKTYSPGERLRVDLALNDAGHELKEFDLSLCQELRFGKSSVVDSLDTFYWKELPSHSLRLFYQLQYGEMIYRYTDPYPDSAFYPAFYEDSFNTIDKIHQKRFINRLALGKKGANSGFMLSLNSENIRMEQNRADTVFHNQWADLLLHVKSAKAELELNTLFHAGGSRNGNYLASARFSYFFSPEACIGTALSMNKQSPAYLFTFVNSNHLRWTNDFEDVEYQKYTIFFRQVRRQLSIDYSYIESKKHIYYGPFITAEQNQGSLGSHILHFRKNSIWKNMHFHNHFLYQYHSDDNILNYPRYMLHSLLYYTNKAFQGNLLFQAGTEVVAGTDFYASRFFPVYGIFYTQNQWEIPAHPLISLFVNGRVKKMLIFVKLEHLNYGWLKDANYIVPFYPRDPRTLRFGFKWLFYD
jgi:hypothetical protein